MSRTLFVAAVAVAATACHHAKPATTPPPTTAEATPAPAPAPATPPAQVPVAQNVAAGDDLVRQCQLHFESQQQAPKFDFDHVELTPDDRNVLQQIADCVTKGPLKGRKLALVGRADPRGTEEYNLGLGDRRANSVASYLERLGVSRQVIATKTRGALDASGSDDAGWKVDRRVDVDLD